MSMEGFFPAGHWVWTIALIACLAPATYELYERGLKGPKWSRGPVGVYLEFPNQIRLYFAKRWPPVWLAKPVLLKADIRSGAVIVSAKLTVTKAPFHRKLLYKFRRLMGLHPTPQSHRQKDKK